MTQIIDAAQQSGGDVTQGQKDTAGRSQRIAKDAFEPYRPQTKTKLRSQIAHSVIKVMK